MASETVAILFALGAATSWGVSSTCVRLGIRYMPTTLGTLISLIVGLGLTAALVLAFQLDKALSISAAGAASFALVGVLNFVLGRYMNFLSIEHLGVARSVPVTSAAPLFGTLLAVLFTGERPDLATLIGGALVLAGVYVTLRSPGAQDVEP